MSQNESKILFFEYPDNNEIMEEILSLKLGVGNTERPRHPP